MQVRGITVCVNYAQLLAITLPRNMRHLVECMVVTSPEDEATKAVCRSVEGVKILETDAATRHHARFNKGLCMEEGFDAFGRHGQMLIWDSDILFPTSIPWGLIRPKFLNGCRRRILNDPSRFRDGIEWRTFPVRRDGGPIGFWQCFHADDPAIGDKRPWYDVSFGHAGGGDAYFLTHWDAGHKCVLQFDVLHLGSPDMNWFGTDQEDRDMMARFVTENNWVEAKKKHTPESARRSGEVIHRVEVPGYPPSDFEIPFVKRSK